MHSVGYSRVLHLLTADFISIWHLLQADDVSALLTAAMPPSALPSCCKPQVLNGMRSPAATTDALSSGPSSPSSLSAASSLDNLSGSFSELSSVVSSSGTEGASSLEKKEGEISANISQNNWYWIAEKSFLILLNSNETFSLYVQTWWGSNVNLLFRCKQPFWKL